MIKLQPSPENLHQAIKDEQRRRMATFTRGQHTYQSDPASVQAMQARAALMEEGESVLWVTANNDAVEMTKNALLHLAKEAARRNDRVMEGAAGLKSRAAQGFYVDITAPTEWG